VRSAAALLLSLWPVTAQASVLFQNTGTLTGWDRLFTQHAGTNTVVASPTFRGATAVENKQVYQGSGSGNYHSEIETYRIEKTDEDLYYGQAIYLPAEWVFHTQNVTFQQWAPDDNSGPWILMFVEDDKILVGIHGIGRFEVAPITALRGTWIRVVVRIKLAAQGVFEAWINGAKMYSRPGSYTVSGGSIRWSAGIYCTRWDTDRPAGLTTQSIFHDHYRVATSYEEAEPESWDDSGSTPPDAAPAAVPDAAAADAARGDAGIPPVPPDATPPPEPQPVPPRKPPARGGGCEIAGTQSTPPIVALALLANAVRRRRRA
jgi:hypothetical protein